MGGGAQYFWIQWQWFFPGSCSNIPSVRLQLKLFLNIRSGSVRLTRSSNTRILLARGNPGRCQRLISLDVPDSNVCRSKRHVWTAVISCKFRAKNVSPPVLICLSCLFYFIDSLVALQNLQVITFDLVFCFLDQVAEPWRLTDQTESLTLHIHICANSNRK